MGKDLNGKELGKGFSQLDNKTYTARFTNRFGEREQYYNKSLSALKTAFSAAKREDELHLNTASRAKSIKLLEWYSIWTDSYKEGYVRDTTMLFYFNLFHKHISPYFSKQPLNNIQQMDIKRFLTTLKDKGLGYEMRNKARIMLFDMFDKAIINDLIIKNPVKGIKYPRDEEKEIRVLSQDEQATFLNCSKGTFYDNLFVVAVNSGLRPGELFALEPSDIDFDKKEIDVNKTLLYQKLLGDEKKTFHIHPPKTKSSIRKVPMNRECEFALKKQLLQSYIIKSKTPKEVDEKFKNLLFTTKFGTPINSQIYMDAIECIVNEINLVRYKIEEMEKFSGHAFRHTFATRCFEAGIQPKTVQNFLGHSTLQMTMDLYTHVLESHKQNEMLKLENQNLNILNNIDDKVEEEFNKLQANNNVINFAKSALA